MSDDFGCEILFKWTYSCRLCLSTQPDIDLFSKDSTSEGILSKLRSCLNLLVYNGDPMPRKLCSKCFAKLIDWWQFREECVKVEQSLKQRLQPYIKIDFVQDYFDRCAKFTSSEVVSSSSKLLSSKPAYEEVNSSTTLKTEVDDDGFNLPSGNEDRFSFGSNSEVNSSGKLNPQLNTSNTSTEPEDNPIEKTSSETKKRSLEEPAFSQSSKRSKNWEENEETPVGTIVSVTGCASDLWSNPPSELNKSAVIDYPPDISEGFDRPLIKQERFNETCPQCNIDFYTEESYSSHGCFSADFAGPSSEDNNYFGDNPETQSPDSEDKKALRRSLRKVPRIETYSEDVISLELKQSLDLRGKLLLQRRKPCPLVHKIKRTQKTSKKIATKLTPWKCTPCFQYFQSRANLVSHYLTSKCKGHQTNVVTCEICQRQFLTLSELIQHQVVHLRIKINLGEEDLVCCGECNLRFADERRLEWHSIVHDPKDLPEDADKFPCIECSEIYISQELYEEHVLTHHQQITEHVCCYCNSQFAFPNQLHLHIQQVHNGAQFKCPSCSKTFASKSELEEHQKSHISSTRCFRCGQVFANAKELEQHELIKHKNPTPFSCRKCLLRFSARSQLLMHINTHNQSDSSQSLSSESGSINVCDLCDAKFLLPADLQLHMKTHKIKIEYPGEVATVVEDTLVEPEDPKYAKFKCSLCSKLFVRSFSIIRHAKQIHKGLEVVPLKLKRPVLIKARRRRFHSSKLLFRCTKCPKYFFSKENLTVHVTKAHPIKKLPVKIDSTRTADSGKCPFCDKDIKTLSVHIKKHHLGEVADPSKVIKDETVSSELQCRFCFRVCSTPHNRKAHESIHTTDKVEWVKCTKCGKSFYNQIMLQNHTLKCTSRRPKCEKCDRVFSRKKYLDKHRLVCSLFKVENEHKCGQCPLTFTSLTTLQWHMLKTHIRNQTANQQNQQSQQSQQSQPSQPSSSKAAIVETIKAEKQRQDRLFWREESNKIVCKVGDKYYCTYCDCEFSTAGEFDNHRSVHPRGNNYAVEVGDNLFQCTICDKMFESRKGALIHINYHKKINDESESRSETSAVDSVAKKKKSIAARSFRCPLCISTFATEEGFKKHVYVAHSEGLSEPNN